MTSPMVIDTVEALRKTVATWRAAGERISYVPTMGALHQGHLSLVRLARKQARRVIVSIFVNPTQFAAHEDLGAYPRTFDADLGLLADVQADAVFFPAAAEMYPPGFSSAISLAGPAAVGLEDSFRPGHFSGVATVVAKLLLQGQPDLAIFGEKDYQQLCVIRRVVRDLNIPVEILGGPTVRAPSGLALSSRNAYMTPRERDVIAPKIHLALTDCAAALRAGGLIDASLAKASHTLEMAGFELDYLDLRDADSLARPNGNACDPKQMYRLLVAARLPRVRLIDNIAV